MSSLLLFTLAGYLSWESAREREPIIKLESGSVKLGKEAQNPNKWGTKCSWLDSYEEKKIGIRRLRETKETLNG
jgi:hypothetical protein